MLYKSKVFHAFWVCSWLPCGHLIEKCQTLVCDVILCICHFHTWYPGSRLFLIVSIHDLCTFYYSVVITLSLNR